MIKQTLLKILCCPETKQALSAAEPSLIHKINEKIEKGKLQNCGRFVVKQTIEEGLIREDKKILYPVCHGIPLMLVNEAIPLDGIL
ncbi:MAG TPA: hypothetical protein PLO78_02730 [Candidatus Omnitrophota bacterium]|nr:hypothetical protein [Candidatus Omnitrophota bacterium]